MSKNINIPAKDLLEAIDRYFDCTLSDKEERELRNMLATTDSDDPSILEAKALLGFHTIKRWDYYVREAPSSRRGLSRKKILLRISGIAAAVILMFALGITIINGELHNHDECFAYINGKRVTDEEIVMNILVENISELDQGAEDAHNLFIEDLNDLIPTGN